MSYHVLQIVPAVCDQYNDTTMKTMPSIFHFSSAQNEFFCEGPTIYLLQIGPSHFSKILGHI